MTGHLPLLRFLRDSEASLREIAAVSPDDIAADLLRVADGIAHHATQLLAKREPIRKS